MFDLKERKALVTGGTGGIGAAVVSALVAAGAQVVASGTNQAKLDALTSQYGEQVLGLSCDLSDTTSLPSLVTAAETLLNGLDILVCNAGITRDDITLRMKEQQWNEVIALNLTANFKLNQAAIKAMLRRRYGRIINISSVVGSTGNYGQANYAAAKAGLEGMTKSIALEVASRGITVNAIAPGFIQTPMTEKLSQEVKGALKNKIPMGRMGEVEDIAQAVVFLSSEASSYITGHTLHINGGLYMA